jgi:hypothetical protein
VADVIGSAVLDWLLETENPSVRYLTLRELLGRSEHDTDVADARSALMGSSQVRAILNAQYPAGYWIKPDRGYSPKHKATVWQLIFLADLGAEKTPGIAHACEHVMGAALHEGHSLFSAHKHSTGVYPCLNGDLVRVLQHFGYDAHPTVCTVIDALAKTVCMNGWACVKNSVQARNRTTWQPCVWGCVKVLRGFATIPPAKRSQAVRQAIDAGTRFVLSHDLACDQSPSLVDAPSNWLRFGFPLGYGSDLLEALLALAELGVTTSQPKALEVVLDKRVGPGQWLLEHPLSNTWAHFGVEGTPNKWITWRALKVLQAMDSWTMPFL